MNREDFLEAYGIAAERAREIARLKYLLGEENSVAYDAEKAIGFTEEGAVLVTHERATYDDYYEVDTFVVPWNEIEDYDATVASLKARVEAKKRAEAEAERDRKREMLERLKKELGE